MDERPEKMSSRVLRANRLKEDAAVLEEGHGGYEVVTRFRERFRISNRSPGENLANLDDVVRLHPYLRRIAHRGLEIDVCWCVPRGTDEPGEARLAYFFHDPFRDSEEAVLMDDPVQVRRWIDASLRRR